MLFFPESLWAKGSSKSGGLLYIFTCSHLHHIFSSFHRHTFTSSSLHIFWSSRLRIFSSSHLHTFASSHLHTSSLCFSLLHIFSSSHLHIFSLCLSFSLSLCLSLSLSIVPACSLSRSLSFFFFSLLSMRAVRTRHRDMATFSHEMRFDCQKPR